MTEIADIGFRVNTADIEKGAQGLNKLAAAAAGVDTANLKMVKIAEVAGIKVAKAATDAARATLRESEATVKKLRDSKSATEQEIKAAIAIRKTAAANLDAARATEQRTRATVSQSDALRQQNALARALSVPSTVVGSVASGGRVSAAPAVIDQKIEMARAAQAASNAQYEFNALLGVNQQLEKSARSSASAFIELYKAQELAAKSAMMVDKPSTRVSGVVNGGRVALARDQMPNRFNTANIAAQFQDIGVTAAMGMNPMTIALQQGTQLSAIMNSMESPLKGIAEAFRSIFNATSLLAIGLVGVVAALIQFTDWTKVGQSVLNGLADVIEATLPYLTVLGVTLLGIFSPAIFAGIVSITRAIFTMGSAALVAGAKMAFAWAMANPVTAGILIGVTAVVVAIEAMGGSTANVLNKMIGFFVGAFNAVKATWKMLPAAMGDIVIRMVNLVLNKIQTLITSSIGLINGFISKIPEKFRPDGAIIEWKPQIEIENPFEGMADKVDNMANEEFSKAMKSNYIGDAGKWVGDKLRGAASSIGAAASGKDKKEKKDPWEELVGDAERKIAVLKAEQAAIGMTEQATAKLRYETELLNEAQQKGIVLDEMKRTKIGELAAGMAETEAETKRLKDAYQFLQDASKGFISDLRNGLEEGKSLWESFGNAVKNVIDKMIDKILNSQIESLMSSIIPSGGGGSGGLLGGLAGILGGAFGGGGIESSIASSIAANPSIFAKGGAFNNGLIPFAKGGAFTNGIVNRATPFAFADGGAFGVMGEAGPEAVMPLHRGPDGSLGVRMSGGASNDNATPQQNVTYVINAPGASKADLESVKQTLMAMAGPGVTEQRVQMAQARGVL